MTINSSLIMVLPFLRDDEHDRHQRRHQFCPTTENQIPSIPKIMGKISTAATWNSRLLKNEIRAEVSPSFNAVKKDDP